jgi:dihydrofolate reductase
MARLIYSAIASLDGYVEDAGGHFDWAAPDEQVHSFVNDLERPIGTYLYGRRMYETLLPWETTPLNDQPAFAREFTEIWRGAEKIVYSRSLRSARSAKTTIERNFDPEAVRRLKAAAREDLTIGGADLAGQALRAGLVDELQFFAVPILVGGGKRWLPKGVHLDVQLEDTHRFANGTLYANYRLNGQVPA